MKERYFTTDAIGEIEAAITDILTDNMDEIEMAIQQQEMVDIPLKVRVVLAGSKIKIKVATTISTGRIKDERVAEVDMVLGA